jgi:hypothetical protein
MKGWRYVLCPLAFTTLILLLSGGTGSASFTDITSISQTAGPGWYGGHGVQFCDATADGRPDFYVTMNADQDMADLFYRNVDGALFAEEADLRAIASFDSGSHGGVWADLDNDGPADYLKFLMPFDGTVYVAYDSRAVSLPYWMDGFADTGDAIQTSLATQPLLMIYAKPFAAGDCVALGANKADGFTGDTVSNFILFYGE